MRKFSEIFGAALLALVLGSVPAFAFRCNTGQSGCSGSATFGPMDRPASFRILYANGGSTNFVLYNSGNTATYSVREGDTYQWEWGTSGVPNNNVKWFIGVN